MKIKFVGWLIFAVFLNGCDNTFYPITDPPKIQPKPEEEVENIRTGYSNYCSLSFEIRSPHTILSQVTNKNYVTFISSDTIVCEGYNSIYDSNINWVVMEENGLGACSEKRMNSMYVDFQPATTTITDYTIYQQKTPLKISISATLENFKYPGMGFVGLNLEQDNIDDLRQEYLDVFKTRGVPDGVTPRRSQFDKAKPINLKLLGDCICGRHSWHIVAKLDQHATQLRASIKKDLDIDLPISSGYRCPVGNGKLDKAKKSKHMYGVALDWDFGDNNRANSALNYEIYEHCRTNYSNPRTVIILYDESMTQYFYPEGDKGENDKAIPEEYDASTSPIVFIQGHVDWRKEN